MTTRARGTFEVTMNPLETYAGQEDPLLGRYGLVKKFSGDLAGTSKGEMLSAMTGLTGSAGYVAIERVNGTLHGRSGSFLLQHGGTMTRGTQQLAVTVVPDSGTGELEGLTGAMSIDVADGTHSYVFEYTLPEKKGGSHA